MDVSKLFKFKCPHCGYEAIYSLSMNGPVPVKCFRCKKISKSDTCCTQHSDNQ